MNSRPAKTSPRKPPNERTRRPREHRTLALASGGVAGLLYQLGVLEALGDAGDGFDATSFDAYIGVGSGAALAALLANGIPPKEIALAFEGASKRLPPFHLGKLLRPNFREMAAKGIAV